MRLQGLVGGSNLTLVWLAGLTSISAPHRNAWRAGAVKDALHRLGNRSFVALDCDAVDDPCSLLRLRKCGANEAS